MKIAQELYEGIDVGGDGPVGLITYMRTDSLRMSDDFVDGGPRPDPGRVRRPLPAREAEQIRRRQAGAGGPRGDPADRPVALDPETDQGPGCRSTSTSSTRLIYRRAVASQMTPAVFAVTNVSVAAGEGVFKTQGKILKFDGYRRVLAAGRQAGGCAPAGARGRAWRSTSTTSTRPSTSPSRRPGSPRPTLIKALEKENIGRPSTYAPIIQTIQDRLYVEQKERRFFATDLGMIVTDVLVEYFPKIMDFKFTAHMEDELDEIATAKVDMVKVLDEFYHPFQEDLKLADGATCSGCRSRRRRPATSAARRWW